MSVYANTNYTLKVYKIDKDWTDAPGTVILELDGKLSTKAKREIQEAIGRGDVTIRERVKRIA